MGLALFNKKRGFRVLEWLVIGALIGLVLLAAFRYYSRMAEDVQRLSFEVAARNFRMVATALHAQGVVQRTQGHSAPEGVLVSRFPELGPPAAGGSAVRVFLNEQGWPVNALSSALAQDNQLEVAECLSLWRAFFPEASAEGYEAPQPPSTVSPGVWMVDTNGGQQCRYRQANGGKISQYFDYYPASGRVSVDSSKLW